MTINVWQTFLRLNYSVFWVITQRRLVKHWRFGTTYRFHLHGSSGQLTHEDKTGCPETSVFNQPTLCNIPEDGIIQVNRSAGLRSRLYEIKILQINKLTSCLTQNHSIQGQYIWDFWLTKWHRDRCCSKYSSFPCYYHSINCSYQR